VEPDQQDHHIVDADAGGGGAAQHGLHVLERVEAFPGIAVELLPRRSLQSRAKPWTTAREFEGMAERSY